MRRRIFILGLGTAMVARPLGANAQPAAIPRVGYVWVGRRGTDVSGAGLRKGLSDLGYEIGRNITLEERYADDDGTNVPTLISELLAQKVDIFVTPGA
ncbi:MAG: hypothetical protein JOZ88_08545, partial [Hyphomicrobiales bacterium]|nr:hypothetical protein [Hyphomicrobiales bacterium]